MQDIQNIPNPDVNSTEREDEFGNHSDIERENESSGSDTENIPLPPTEPMPAAIEEPPDEDGDITIDEPRRKPSQIV
ncbi:MAG TPA: hypothetical protein VIL74_16095 [Pyrinomonadaceae bacterium]|jgi:hypothetical protein